MEEAQLNTFDLIVLVVYVLIVLSWGLKNAAKKSAEGYFLGGRNMTWPVIGVSMFAMMVSGSAIIGWSGDAFSTGISVFNYGLSGGVFVLIFFLIFVLPFYLSSGVYTTPEFLERRFDKRSKYYLSFITLVAYILGDAAITLYAGALMMSLVAPGLEVWQMIWIIALLSASYTIFGGLSSVMMVDLIQAFILLVGAVIVTIFAFEEAGGWSHVMSVVDRSLLSLVRPINDESVPWPALVLSLPILGFYFWCTSQAMVQRTLSAKNEDHARLGNLFSTVLMFSSFFFMILPGIAGKVLYPDLEQADMIFPTLMFELLPHGLIGLVMAALLAAITSTLSAILNSASTLFTMDFARIFIKNMDSKKQVKVGRVSGLVIICLAALWAPQIAKAGSIIKYFQEVLSYLAPPIVAVFILGLFWKRGNAQGAFSALAGGLVAALLMLLFKPLSPIADWHFLYVAPLLLLLAIFIFVLISLATPEPGLNKTDGLVWSVSLIKLETERLQSFPWYKNYRYLSLIVIGATILFIYYWR